MSPSLLCYFWVYRSVLVIFRGPLQPGGPVGAFKNAQLWLSSGGVGSCHWLCELDSGSTEGGM